MFIRLTHDKYKIFSEDMNLEFEHENNYSFDISYLAQKVVGHDIEIYCDAYIKVTKKDNYVEITDLGLIIDGIDSDEDVILINEKIENLIKEYGV